MNSSAECKLGLVVSEDVEAAALDKVTEVLAGKVGSKQLAVKGTVAPLTGFYLFGKEGNQAANFINALLKNCTTAVSEAFVMMQVGASGIGCTKSDASVRASLFWVKADSTAKDQFKKAWLC